jgi:hypothetical protein
MTRCCLPNQKYYKKGIKCFLTVDMLETFWVRDSAFLMEKPSIDRIDNSKDYTLENCRFIELDENRRNNWQGRRRKK